MICNLYKHYKNKNSFKPELKSADGSMDMSRFQDIIEYAISSLKHWSGTEGSSR